MQTENTETQEPAITDSVSVNGFLLRQLLLVLAVSVVIWFAWTTRNLALDIIAVVRQAADSCDLPIRGAP